MPVTTGAAEAAAAGRGTTSVTLGTNTCRAFGATRRARSVSRGEQPATTSVFSASTRSAAAYAARAGRPRSCRSVA
jgi:hypothetical protein